MNAFDFAMQMESDAEKLYRKLADKSPVKGIKAIFHGLADDEKRHYELFRELKKALPAPLPQDSKVLDHARSVFAELLEGRDDMSVLQDNLEGYRYAMKLEAEGTQFYEDAARRENDPQVKKLLEAVAGEERKHFNIVENIYRFVNAPNEYLAWAEFSNMGDFHAFGRDIDL